MVVQTLLQVEGGAVAKGGNTAEGIEGGSSLDKVSTLGGSFTVVDGTVVPQVSYVAGVCEMSIDEQQSTGPFKESEREERESEILIDLA